MRRSLVVGINKYNHGSFGNLKGCVRDATAVSEVLKTHENGNPNFECNLVTDDVKRTSLRGLLAQLFSDGPSVALFYFSGHGAFTSSGGWLLTQDAEPGDWGIGMDEILTLAHNSNVSEIYIIIDACHSGVMGNFSAIQDAHFSKAMLREGMTVLAASRPTEAAIEIGSQGLFTALLLHALHGGASDVLGNVSAASIYAHIEQALGAWDQRPLYKSYATRLSPLRRCDPAVAPKILRLLPQVFQDPLEELRLDASFEHTHASADPKNVSVFNWLKEYRNARLVRTVTDEDLYFAALNGTTVKLTGLGRFYWTLAKDGKI